MSDATGMTVNNYLQWQRQISHAESENASKFCSAPVSMRFDGDDIHVLYPGGSRWFRSG